MRVQRLWLMWGCAALAAGSGCRKKEAIPPPDVAEALAPAPIPDALTGPPSRGGSRQPAPPPVEEWPGDCAARWTMTPAQGLTVIGAAFVGDIPGHLVVSDGGFHILLVAPSGRATATSLGSAVGPEGVDAPAADYVAIGAVVSGGDRYMIAFGSAGRDSMTVRARAVMPDGRLLPVAGRGRPGAEGGPVIEWSDESRIGGARLAWTVIGTRFLLWADSPSGDGAAADFAVLTPTGYPIETGQVVRRDAAVPFRAFALGRDVVFLGGGPADPVRCFHCPAGPGPDDPGLPDMIAGLEPAWLVGMAGERAVVHTAARRSGARARGDAPESEGRLVSVRLARRNEIEPFAFADGWMPEVDDAVLSSTAFLWRFAAGEDGSVTAVAYDRAGAVAHRVSLPAGVAPMAVALDGKNLLYRRTDSPYAVTMCTVDARSTAEPIRVDWRSTLANAAPPEGGCGR